MSVPAIRKDVIKEIFPSIEEVWDPKFGGQKIAFPCRIAENVFMLKIAKIDGVSSNSDEEGEVPYGPDDILSRMNREIETLSECISPHLVKLGPIPITKVHYGGDSLLCYSEEYIRGKNLDEILTSSGPVSMAIALKLAIEMGQAIETLWKAKKVHRDIKPNNIMFEEQTERFVLLDMGFVLDTKDVWLTAPNQIPGTIPYLSPEQLDLTRKQHLDFRSDLYQLGVVIYQAITGRHPFVDNPNSTESEIIGNILDRCPASPKEIDEGINKGISLIVMRLLSKEPHARFRTPVKFIEAINELKKEE